MVTVLDDQGTPVISAEVTGYFTGDFDGDDGGGQKSTDESGMVTFTTTGDPIKGKLSFGFCVVSVSGIDPNGLPYCVTN